MTESLDQQLLTAERNLFNSSGFTYRYSSKLPYLECIVRDTSADSKLSILTKTYYDPEDEFGYRIISSCFQYEEDGTADFFTVSARSSNVLADDDSALRVLDAISRSIHNPAINKIITPYEDYQKTSLPDEHDGIVDFSTIFF